MHCRGNYLTDVWHATRTYACTDTNTYYNLTWAHEHVHSKKHMHSYRESGRANDTQRMKK